MGPIHNKCFSHSDFHKVLYCCGLFDWLWNIHICTVIARTQSTLRGQQILGSALNCLCLCRLLSFFATSHYYFILYLSGALRFVFSTSKHQTSLVNDFTSRGPISSYGLVQELLCLNSNLRGPCQIPFSHPAGHVGSHLVNMCQSFCKLERATSGLALPTFVIPSPRTRVKLTFVMSWF